MLVENPKPKMCLTKKRNVRIDDITKQMMPQFAQKMKEMEA